MEEEKKESEIDNLEQLLLKELQEAEDYYGKIRHFHHLNFFIHPLSRLLVSKSLKMVGILLTHTSMLCFLSFVIHPKHQLVMHRLSILNGFLKLLYPALNTYSRKN